MPDVVGRRRPAGVSDAGRRRGRVSASRCCFSEAGLGSDALTFDFAVDDGAADAEQVGHLGGAVLAAVHPSCFVSGSSAVTAWMSRTRSEMRAAKTRLSTTSSPHWLRIPGCCAADTATGSWCCTQGVLPRWKSRPAVRSCKRPQSLQPLLFRLVRNPGGFSWSCEDSQRAEGMHRGDTLPRGIRSWSLGVNPRRPAEDTLGATRKEIVRPSAERRTLTGLGRSPCHALQERECGPSRERQTSPCIPHTGNRPGGAQGEK